jgi:hypothetical protein
LRGALDLEEDLVVVIRHLDIKVFNWRRSVASVLSHGVIVAQRA